MCCCVFVLFVVHTNISMISSWICVYGLLEYCCCPTYCVMLCHIPMDWFVDMNRSSIHNVSISSQITLSELWYAKLGIGVSQDYLRPPFLFDNQRFNKITPLKLFWRHLILTTGQTAMQFHTNIYAMRMKIPHDLSQNVHLFKLNANVIYTLLGNILSTFMLPREWTQGRPCGLSSSATLRTHLTF